MAVVGSFSTWGGKTSINNIDVRNQYDSLPRLKGENGSTGFRLNFSGAAGYLEYGDHDELRIPACDRALG